MFAWWRDVIHESVVEHAHSPVVKIGLRYGMALFIASEVMFFVAFFWAFFSTSLFPSIANNGVWPPPGIEAVGSVPFPAADDARPAALGTTATWAALLRFGEGENDVAIQALWCTIGLGVFFTMCQLYEYSHAEFGFRQGIFPSTFFMATGFHGFHVLVGTIFLSVCLWRTYQHQFTPASHFGFEAAAWVLAFRRRGVAVSVLRDLYLGRPAAWHADRARCSWLSSTPRAGRRSLPERSAAAVRVATRMESFRAS